MLIVIAACAVMALLAANSRVWMDFARLSDQLNTEIRAHRRLFDEHQDRLNQLRARAKTLTEVIQDAVTACDLLEQQIHEKLAELEGLKQRLERVRPRDRQVDKDRNAGISSWPKP